MPFDPAILRTPPHHGDLLVEPSVPHWQPQLRENSEQLGNATVRLGDQSLARSRAETRMALAGCGDAPIIVLGHQPEFIHPGVWAKHVVADRFARSVGGVALNLIVDNDVLKSPAISLPHGLDGQWSLRTIRFASAGATTPYEFLPALRPDDLNRLEENFRAALGDAFSTSALPVYFEGLKALHAPRDWVDQTTAGRRAVDRAFGINLHEHRVSSLSFLPLLLETLREPRRFARAYNDALGDYRNATAVRDPRRPMPDLCMTADRCELPWWSVRGGLPRQRLFLAQHANRYSLMAESTTILEMTADDLSSTISLSKALARQVTWAIRPRALTLTLWAQLLLADFFIHGIGGAKYDAVCDAIIQRYFDLAPPHFAAVSATLRWHPPSETWDVETEGSARLALRDARHNPQRYIPNTNAAAELITERQTAIEIARELAQSNPRDRIARRSAYHRIHAANAAILERQAKHMHRLEARLADARHQAQQTAIALGREYFFAAHPLSELGNLAAALPVIADFAV